MQERSQGRSPSDFAEKQGERNRIYRATGVHSVIHVVTDIKAQ